MSKGGGSTTTEPWSGVQPYLQNQYAFANQALYNPPQYYPGQQYVGPLPQEQAAWQNQANFLGSVFGQPIQLNPSYPQYNTAPNAFYPGTDPTTGSASKGGATSQPGGTQTPTNWDFNDPSNNPGGAAWPTTTTQPYYAGGNLEGTPAPTVGGTTKGGATSQPTTTGSTGKGGTTTGTTTQQPTSSPYTGAAPSYDQLVGTGSNLMSGGPTAGMTNLMSGLYGSNLAGMFSGPQNMIGEPYNLYQGLQAPQFNWQAGDLMQGVNPVNLGWGGPGDLMQGVQGAQIDYQMPNLQQGIQQPGINYQMPDLTQGISTPQLNWQAPNLQQGISTPQINYGPYQAPNLTQGLQGANINYQMPDLQQGISRTLMDPSQFTPSLSQNVQDSLAGMMSGQADYSQLQAMVDAATTPMMRNFENQILPELANRTNLFNNNTGAIKDLNRIIPEMERNVGDIGAQLAWQERMRADQAQQFGTQLGAQTDLQRYGMGLQGAGQQAGLDQATQALMANMGLSGAQLGAGLASQQAGLDQSFQQLLAGQRGLEGQLGLQGWQTGAGLAGQQAGLDAQTQALLANMGLSGAQLGLQGATTQAGLDQATQQLLAGQNLAGAQIGSGLAATEAGLGMDYASLLGQLNLGGANIGSSLAGQQAGLDWNLANLMAQQNLAGSQMGLQGATTQAGLLQNYMNTLAQQNTAQNQLGLQGAQFGANLGMDWNQLLGNLNQAQGQLGLNTDIAQQQAFDAYRGDVLGMGGLYNNLAGQTSQNMQAGAGMFPSMMQMGMLPGQFQQDYASQFLRPFAEQSLMGDQARYNYYQNLPMQMGDWYSGILSGAGGLGGTQQNQLGAGQTAQNVANMGMMAYALYLMSDRELKSDIRPARPVLEALKKLPIYNWRYRGDPTPHIGPMAQDFQEAFGVGDGRTIHLVDVVGVLLGAMKELAQQKEATA